MQAYKYHTTVLDNGIIQIPEMKQFADRDVDVFIVIEDKSREKNIKQSLANDFINKWGGFLEGHNVEDAKFEYLMEKHK